MSDCSLIINPVPKNIHHQFAGVWEKHAISTELEPIAFCHAEDGRVLFAGMARLSPSENIADAQEAEIRMREAEEEERGEEEGLLDWLDGDVSPLTGPVKKNESASSTSSANGASNMLCILQTLNEYLGREEHLIDRDIYSIVKSSANGSIGSEAILVILDPDKSAVYLCKTDTLYPSEKYYQGARLCRMEIDHLPDDIHCHAVDYIRQVYVRQKADPEEVMLFIASRPKTLNPDLDVDRYVKSKRLMLFGADGRFVAQGDKPVFARNTTMSGFSSQFHIRPEGDAQQNAEGRHTHDPFPALYKDLSIFYFVDGVDGFEWLADAKEDIMTLHWHGYGLVYLSATFLSRDKNRPLSWDTIRECIKIIRGEENLSYYVSLCSAAPYLFYNILGLSPRRNGPGTRP